MRISTTSQPRSCLTSTPYTPLPQLLLDIVCNSELSTTGIKVYLQLLCRSARNTARPFSIDISVPRLARIVGAGESSIKRALGELGRLSMIRREVLSTQTVARTWVMLPDGLRHLGEQQGARESEPPTARPETEQTTEPLEKDATKAAKVTSPALANQIARLEAEEQGLYQAGITTDNYEDLRALQDRISQLKRMLLSERETSSESATSTSGDTSSSLGAFRPAIRKGIVQLFKGPTPPSMPPAELARQCQHAMERGSLRKFNTAKAVNIFCVLVRQNRWRSVTVA